jgi:acetolactate synthase-1/2/3 large subunit
MYLQDMAARAGRGIENAGIGVSLTDPHINYATLAKAYGMYSSGPIENANDLEPAIKAALAVVKKGEPALIDVVTQPR